MKIIGMISTKGGIGKTQLSQNLAVLFNENEGKAVIFDMDPQQTCLKWAMRRESETPFVIPATLDDLDNKLDVARDEKIQYVIIDTPPRRHDPILTAVVERSDLIITPIRPEPKYLDGLEDTWPEIENSKSAIAVLNAIPADASSDGDDLHEFVVETCPDLPIASARLHYRKAVWQPDIAGKTVSELPQNLKYMKAKAETLALFKQIKKEVK